MTVALCLQTCDRPALTARTLETLAAHNDLSRFVCLHGDDASLTSENAELAQRYGFETVVQSKKRVGMRATRTALFKQAATRADWTILLENDIETVRPFPWALFDFARRVKQVYCLRLYGRWKDRARHQAALTTHKRYDHRPVKWAALRGAPESAQVGQIHWSAQPAVTRVRELLSLHLTGNEPDGLTVRPTQNVTFHLGYERTPGRVL